MLESYECFQIEFLVFSCYNFFTRLSGNLFPDMFSLHIIKREIKRAYIIKKRKRIIILCGLQINGKIMK